MQTVSAQNAFLTGSGGEHQLCSASLVRLTGYVVIELKTGKLQPESAGKLNFNVALSTMCSGERTITKPSES